MIIKYDNKAIKYSNKWVSIDGGTPPVPPVDPYNPLGLPPFTMRVKFTDGYTPTNTLATWTQVSSSPNIWDLTRENPDWSVYIGSLLHMNTNLLEVLGANTSGVTAMDYLFTSCTNLTNVALFDTTDIISHYESTGPDGTATWYGVYRMFSSCRSLISVPLFDFSNIQGSRSMFEGCWALTSIPLFDLSSARDASYMFYNCLNVESGALALYQQASTQANPPWHTLMFANCGRDTTTGAAELAQIPSDWK